ncbi:MAG: ribosome recycling factor [Legionellales bacterium]|nr:ribosome recycling factor [Legionellales bacterium]
MINNINTESKQRMDKAIESLNNELAKLRTGRAHPSLVEHVQVDYYGSKTPLNQVASISVADSRTLLVSPWDKSFLKGIEKSILASDLGLNPVVLGESVKIPMPALTEERRRDLIKVVRNEAESTRVSIRNIRRDANTKFKSLLKEKDITEDEQRKAEDKIQSLTNDYIKEIDEIVKSKEKDLLEI